MKAMILEKHGPIEESPLKLTDVPKPSPGPDEILIKIKVCGVCRTDLHVVEGDIKPPRLPVIPGHQVIGVVEKCGDGAGIFKAGARACVPWLYSACGKCPECLGGSENLCDKALFTGMSVPGGFAEYITVPEKFAYFVPENFPDKNAAPLLCAGAIGYRALKMARRDRGHGDRPLERLGLYGFGASAHVTLQVAAHLGHEVFVFSRTPAHRELAKELGAVWAGRLEEIPPGRLDAAIIFAPSGDIVPVALKALSKGGRLVLAGITMTPTPPLEYSLLYDERSIQSVANITRDDVREFLLLAGQIPVMTEVEEFPLAQANRALRLVKESRIRGAGVLNVQQAKI